MSNLKRVLSLTLASIMLLGMMVVGAGAADYSDVDYSEDNVEAIEVLQAINVMTGDAGANTFRPGDPVSRGEMARIMAALMDLDYQYYISTNPFNDMVGHWAEGYAAACYANGIIAGRTATTYDPDATVTTVEAAAMLMRALGYFQYAVDYANGFEIATISQAGKIDLFDGVDTKTNEPMTRNDVAQLVLNTLKSGMVEPDDNTLNITTTTGDATTTVQGGSVNYVYVTSREAYATAIRSDMAYSATATTNLSAPIVDLGEKLYQGKLTRADVNDALGRPAQHWEYQAKEIGTYADENDYFFSSKVTTKKIYDTVGATAANNYVWDVYLDGELTDFVELADNHADDDQCFLRKALGLSSNQTGNGVVTEVFVDGTPVYWNDGSVRYQGTVTVAIYKLYAAEVLDVTSDGTITLADLGAGPANARDEFATTAFDEGDIVVYTYSREENEIQAVALAERIEGEVTRVRTDTTAGADIGTRGDQFVVNGTTYTYNATVPTGDRLQTENVNNNMVGYLDEFGYCIWIDESAISYDYAYVLSAGTTTQYGDTVVYANLVLTDGTTVSVETDWDVDVDGDVSIAKNELEHRIVAYSVDRSGVYTLNVASPVLGDVGDKLEIHNNVSGFTDGSSRYAANSGTLFIIAETGSSSSVKNYSFSIYEGIANVPDVEGRAGVTKATVATGNGNVAKVVYIENADVSGSDVYFVRADSSAELVKDSEIGNYYQINSYVNGEAVTLNVREGSNAATALVKFGASKANGLKVGSTQWIVALKNITCNSDDLVISVREYDLYDKDTGSGIFTGVKTDRTTKGNVILGDRTPAIDIKEFTTDGSKAVLAQYNSRNETNAYTGIRASSIRKDSNDTYIAVLDKDVITGLCIFYIDGGENESWTDNTSSAPKTEVNITVGANVTVTDSEGNAVTSATTGLYVGDTLTIVADTDCTLVLSGVELVSGSTYRITAATVSIAATKPGDITVSQDTDDVPTGSARVYDANGVAVDSVNVGDVVTVKPAQAVKLTGTGVEEVKDASGNVTGYKITGSDVSLVPMSEDWVYYESGPFKNMWVNTDTGRMVGRPLVAAATVNYIMARAAAVTGSSLEDINVEEEGWIGIFSQYPEGSVIEMPCADGKSALCVVNDAEGLKLVPKGEGVKLGAAIAGVASVTTAKVVPGVGAISTDIKTDYVAGGTLSEIDLDLGQPIPGAALPTKITVDGVATFELTWYLASDPTTAVTGYATDAEYVYTWTMTVADGVAVAENGIDVDGTVYEAENGVYSESTPGGGNTAVDETIKAIPDDEENVANITTWTLYSYKKYEGGLTADQAAAAILTAYNAVDDAADNPAVEVEFENLKVIITLTDGETFEDSSLKSNALDGSMRKPENMYRVTVDGTVLPGYWDAVEPLTIEVGKNYVSEAKPIVKMGAGNEPVVTKTVGVLEATIATTAATTLADADNNIMLVEAIETTIADVTASVSFAEKDHAGAAVAGAATPNRYYIAKGTKLTAQNVEQIDPGLFVPFVVDDAVVRIPGPTGSTATPATKGTLAVEIKSTTKNNGVFSIAPMGSYYIVILDGEVIDKNIDGEPIAVGSVIDVPTDYVLIGDEGSNIASELGNGKHAEAEDGELTLDDNALGGANSSNILVLTSAHGVVVPTTAAGTVKWVAGLSDSAFIGVADATLIVKATKNSSTGKYEAKVYFQQDTADATNIAMEPVANNKAIKDGSWKKVNIADFTLPKEDGTGLGGGKKVYECVLIGSIGATPEVIDLDAKTITGGTAGVMDNIGASGALAAGAETAVTVSGVTVNSTGLAGETVKLYFTPDSGGSVVAGFGADMAKSTTATVGSDGTIKFDLKVNSNVAKEATIGELVVTYGYDVVSDPIALVLTLKATA